MKLLLLVALSSAACASPRPDNERNKKAIGLFTVVQFPNEECQVKSSKNFRGICHSSTECNEKNGQADGSCGAGFGVCCKFIISGTANANVKNNCTYVQNNGYPSSVTTASKTIDYNIKPLTSNICMLRFDFQKLNLGITTVTGKCTDTFTVTSPTGVSMPSLCGDLANQHMYVQVGKSSSDVKASVATGSGTTSRSWNIKVSQIECDNPNKPPSDCTQYYNCGTGTIESFNFNGGLLVALGAKTYSICFRPQTGACGVRFAVDSGTTTPSPFCLPSSKKGSDGKAKDQTGTPASPCTTNGGSRNHQCDIAAIIFPGLQTNQDVINGKAKDPTTYSGNMLCGTALNPFDQKTTSTALFNRGFKIDYMGITSTDVKSANGFKLNFQQTCQ